MMDRWGRPARNYGDEALMQEFAFRALRYIIGIPINGGSSMMHRRCAVLILCALFIAIDARVSRSVAEDKVIFAQAGPLYPMFGEGYGVTKYAEALIGLFETHPAFRRETELALFDKGVLFSSQDEHVEAVSTGAIQLSYCTPHTLEAYEPAFRVGTTPGVFDDFGHFRTAMETPAWRRLHERLADEKGIKILGWLFDAGAIYIFSTTPVNDISDLQRLQIRHPGGKGWHFAIAALGGNPIAIPYTEVVTSLQTNLISALITDFGGGAEYFELESLAPYAVDIPVTLQPICLAANASWWNGLSVSQRNAIMNTLEILDANTFYSELTDAKISAWKSNPKLQVFEPDDPARWRTVMREGASSHLQDIAPGLVAAIEGARP